MNDFCNFGSSDQYNAWGDIGYNLPLVYEIYCKTIQEINGTDPDYQPGDSDKLYVKNGVLYIPNSYKAQYQKENTLYIYDETVTYKDSTLGLVND